MKNIELVVVFGILALAFGFSGPTPAKAFGDWLRGNGACAGTHEPHARHRVVRKHIVTRPGMYEIKRRRGLYGWRKVKVRTRSGNVVWRKKRVLLRPYENIAQYRKPKERWVHKRQRVIAAAPPRPRGAWPDGC